MFERQDEALTWAIKPRVTRFFSWHQSLSPFWQWVVAALILIIALLMELLPLL
jgi:hypothetical protein